IRNGVDTSMTIGDRPMVIDLSYRPWEVSAAGIAALRKELSSNPEQIAPASPIRVQIVGKVRTQPVEKPKPGTKTKSPSQLTEDQIQKLMGDVSGLRDTEKKIRRYAVLKYGAQWKEINPAKVQKDAQGDELYQKVVGIVVHHISTFRRAL